jgi:hypothetical protein
VEVDENKLSGKRKLARRVDMRGLSMSGERGGSADTFRDVDTSSYYLRKDKSFQEARDDDEILVES